MDEDEFKAWLEQQDRETCVKIAARTALRVFPFATRQGDAGDKEKQFALLTGRCILISGVAGTMLTPEIKSAADSARSALSAADSALSARSVLSVLSADSALSTALSALSAALSAVDSAADSADSALSAAYKDTGVDPAKLFQTPLWHRAGPPKELLKAWQKTPDLLDTPEFAFWREWYQGFVDGQPMDWELQREVALIPDEDWDKGPAHIARVIEGIRQRLRTAVAPPLVRDEAAGLFREADDAPLPEEVLGYAVRRIESVLDNALTSSGENGLHEDSYETVTIRAAIAAQDHPSLLAVGFFDACLSFQHTIGDRYPDDTALINLQNALYAVVEEINEQHPQARTRCARLASLAKPEPITPQDREEIARIPDELRGELDDNAQGIIESDVEAILSQEKPPKWRRARLTNWVITITEWMDKAMKSDKRLRWLTGVGGRLTRWWKDLNEE